MHRYIIWYIKYMDPDIYENIIHGYRKRGWGGLAPQSLSTLCERPSPNIPPFPPITFWVQVHAATCSKQTAALQPQV